jgi:ribosomal protein L31
MKHTTQHATVWAVTAMMVIAVLAVAFFKIGPSIEATIKPPLFSSISATVVSLNAGSTDVMITGTKTRDCYIQAASAEVFRDGQWVNGEVKMLKQDGSILTPQEQRIPVGSQFFRLGRVQPSGQKIRLAVESLCHPFWTTKQVLVELDTQFLK